MNSRRYRQEGVGNGNQTQTTLNEAWSKGRGWAEWMEQAEKDWAEARNTGRNEENPEGRQRSESLQYV